MNIKEISRSIQKKITSKGKPEKARWLENYVKHGIRSKGVGIPEIREIVKDANKEHQLSERKVTEQADLLNDLMMKEYTEDKLAAILYLQLFWKEKYENETLDLVSSWFDLGYIADWNVCDWLCVRILTPLLDNRTELAVKEFSTWNKDNNPWKARASLVPFSQSKTMDQHGEVIKNFSIELIKRKERFCKTSVGWVLREYSKFNPEFVHRFLSEFKEWTTKEVIRNATKYIKT